MMSGTELELWNTFRVDVLDRSEGRWSWSTKTICFSEETAMFEASYSYGGEDVRIVEVTKREIFKRIGGRERNTT